MNLKGKIPARSTAANTGRPNLVLKSIQSPPPHVGGYN
jgi:hypothetical protein